MKYTTWINKDSLLVTQLCNIMIEDTHAMISGYEIASQIQQNLEEKMLPNIIEKEALLRDLLANLKKWSLPIE